MEDGLICDDFEPCNNTGYVKKGKVIPVIPTNGNDKILADFVVFAKKKCLHIARVFMHHPDLTKKPSIAGDHDLQM